MIAQILGPLLTLPRAQKRMLQVVADVILLCGSYSLAMLLRLETVDFLWDTKALLVMAPVVPLSIALFIELGFYRQVIRYVGRKAFGTIVIGVLTSALMLWISIWLMGPSIPQTVPVIYALLALITVGGIRFAFREIYSRSRSREKIRVIVYGAGQSGRQTVHSIAQGRDHTPIAFVDDNAELWGTQIAGLRVFPPKELTTLVQQYRADMLLLAIPTASAGRRAQVLRDVGKLSIRVQTIPDVSRIIRGQHRYNEIIEVPIEDLLGRDQVAPVKKLLDRNIAGKVVMVTGAGGSIGSELCRQILKQGPRHLILLDHSEFALYQIGQELGELENVVECLGSVRDSNFVRAIIAKYSVQTIYHAAAYKHVPMVEENVTIGIENNVLGTQVLVDAAREGGVESFTLVSTDKAVRPTNVMGASKRVAEMICQSQPRKSGMTRFSIVRFGNVLGSSGSVIPKFRDQIAKGGPVTVTHPEITRYFMTIPEAAQLVIQAGAMATEHDLFVLDMGEPVKIVELAERMIRLSGFSPVIEGAALAQKPEAGSVRIAFTHPRKGEKLHEEMFLGAATEATQHPRILTATETSMDATRLAALLGALEAACRQQNDEEVRRLLVEAPIGYAPRRALNNQGRVTEETVTMTPSKTGTKPLRTAGVS